MFAGRVSPTKPQNFKYNLGRLFGRDIVCPEIWLYIINQEYPTSVYVHLEFHHLFQPKRIQKGEEKDINIARCCELASSFWMGWNQKTQGNHRVSRCIQFHIRHPWSGKAFLHLKKSAVSWMSRRKWMDQRLVRISGLFHPNIHPIDK